MRHPGALYRYTTKGGVHVAVLRLWTHEPHATNKDLAFTGSDGYLCTIKDSPS
jgi:hypothetical protein